MSSNTKKIPSKINILSDVNRYWPDISGLQTLFSEDFESPVVVGYAQGTRPSRWIGATKGFGATRNGLNNIGSNQVYAFRYTNSGVGTASGVIGPATAGLTYTIYIDVLKDNSISQPALPYRIKFVAYDPSAPRDEYRNDNNMTVLFQLTGNAPSDGSVQTLIQTFVVPDGAGYIGNDLAVRFYGATTSASVDNVIVTAE
jgi:hypothetical protein